MRRFAKQPVALPQRLAHQVKFAVLQVAQPAVNDAGGAAGSPGREVVLVNDQGTLAGTGTLPGDGHAIDSSTNHQDIKILAGWRHTFGTAPLHVYLDAI